MANQITNYQCPACTGPLHFVGESGRLECDYCGSTFSVEEIEAQYQQKNEQAQQAALQAEQQEAAQEEAIEAWDLDTAGTEWGRDGAKLRVYSCPSCAAELICDDTTAATACPYCGNPTVIPGQLSGNKKPDLVIPFKLNKDAAIAALKKHYEKKPLLPKAFGDVNHIQEIKGVYVPFWLYDADVDADMTFDATRTITHTTAKETITETDHFLVRRNGSVLFEKVPVDGSSKMPDGHMDAIEPFDYSELKPFSLAYLPGFYAEKYDVSREESAKRADDRIRRSAAEAIRNTVSGYGSCVTVQQNMTLRPRGVKYALMPVWLLSTTWENKKYLFAMNGQTGKLIGDLPIDKKKLTMYTAGAFAAVSALFILLFL